MGVTTFKNALLALMGVGGGLLVAWAGGAAVAYSQTPEAWSGGPWSDSFAFLCLVIGALSVIMALMGSAAFAIWFFAQDGRP